MSEQPITTSRRLVYNTFFNVVTLASHAVIGFLLIRFFLSRLGKVQYGVWLLIGGSIFKYAPLLSLGLSSSINRYIPVYLAKNDEDGVRRVISTSWFFFVALAAILIVISLVVYRYVGVWFAIEPELVQTAGRLVLIVGFCFAFAMPLQPSTAILSGLQRYDITNLLALVALFLRTILIVVLLQQGYGLLAMGLVFGMSEVTLRALHQIFVGKLLPKTSRCLVGKVDLGLLKEMLAYGINTFLYTMGAIIIQNTSILIIGIFLSTTHVSQFNVALGGVFLLSQLLQAFTAAIKPAVSDLDARNDHLRVKEIAFLTQKYSLLLLFPSGCFLVMMGKEFLQIWVGDQFKDPGDISQMAVVLIILTIGYCLMLAQHSNFLVLVGRGQHRIFGALTALMALLCILMSVISVKILDWGLIGIAWSNFLPMLLISGITLPIYFNRKMHISWIENLRDVWRPALLGSLPAVICISFWKYTAPPGSWPKIGGVVAASAFLTALGGWFLTLTELERKRFIGMALQKKNRG